MNYSQCGTISFKRVVRPMPVRSQRKPASAKRTPGKSQAMPPAKVVVVTIRTSLTRQLRERMNLSQALFSRLLSVSVRSLAKLESGTPPTEGVARRLNELSRLTTGLGEVIKKESLGTWLQTPNSAFNDLKPLEVIERGESDCLWSMIFYLRSGVAS